MIKDVLEYKSLPDPEFEQRVGELMDRLRQEFGKVVIGLTSFREKILLALVTERHIIAHASPGTGKTLSFKTIFKLAGLEVSHFQGNAERRPSHFTGYMSVQYGTYKKGLGYANGVLYDEINRAPETFNDSLLTPLEEKFFIPEGTEEKMRLPRPYVVFATMNPLGSEGRALYPIPAALLNRFMMRYSLEELGEEEFHRAIIQDAERRLEDITPIASADTLRSINDYVRAMADRYDQNERTPVTDYITRLAAYSRKLAANEKYEGMTPISPRAARSLIVALTGERLLHGRPFIAAEDVHRLLHPCWNHRLNLGSEEVHEVIDEMLRQVPWVPRR
jgi:MoxR-like ATPase